VPSQDMSGKAIEDLGYCLHNAYVLAEVRIGSRPPALQPALVPELIATPSTPGGSPPALSITRSRRPRTTFPAPPSQHRSRKLRRDKRVVAVNPQRPCHTHPQHQQQEAHRNRMFSGTNRGLKYPIQQPNSPT
jgi:hypothetical protein